MRNIFIFSAVLLLLLSGCPNEPKSGNNDQPGNDDDPPVVVTPGKYAEQFRGEWIRIDNGDRWYISGSSIQVNGNPSNLNVSLTRTSENVVSAAAGSSKYTLFAARTANASFNAQVLMLDGERGNPAARDLIGNTGRKPPVKIRNPKQPDLPPVTVEPDQDTGEIIVEGVIPGDEVEIIPDDPEWEDTTVSLTPGFGEDQNLGAIPLTHGDNFKVSIRPTWTDIKEATADLYADETPQDYIIELENIGAANSGDGDIKVSWDDTDFSLAGGNTILEYANIPRGEKKGIPVSLISKSIETEQKIKELKINIRNYDSVSKQVRSWDDTVSVNYYNTAIPFRFRSEKEVQGIIKSKNGKSYYFKTEKTGLSGNFYAEVNVPWSTDEYIIAFLGATIESGAATKYSFGVNAFPPINWSSISNMDFLSKYKPDNENEKTAPIIDLTEGTQTFMGYLAGDSIDYYRVRLGDTPPANIPDEPIAVDIGNLGEQLAALSAASKDNPAMVKLEQINFTTSTTVPDNTIGWGEINDIVLYAQKYIILDLSDCTAEGNILDGIYSTSIESGNHMNIIQGNVYLKGIILPANLKIIGDTAFYNCDYLENVTLGTSVTSIEERAFSSSGIKSIIIPDSVTSMGWYAFEYCSNLTSVIFKKSGIVIDNTSNFFPGNLVEVYKSEGEGSYTRTAESNDWIKEGGAIAAIMEELAALTNTSADSPATAKLAATNISDKWGRINNALKAAGKYIILDLSDCTATENTVIGKASPKDNDMNIIKDNQYIKGIILPSTMESIGEYAFYNCTNLTGITIPGSVVSIELNGFQNSGLTGITIPDSVTSIKQGAFADCPSLTAVTIPANVTSFGGQVFIRSTNITSVTFKGSDINISSANFPGNLNTAYTAEGAGTYIRNEGSNDWSKVDGAVALLLEQLNNLGSTSADNPAKVTLAPANLTNVWGAINTTVQAAQKHVILDLSICTFEGNAITGASSPTGNNMNVIRNNSYIKGIILPSTLKTIGNYAFFNCSNLTGIMIGDSVTSIGGWVFNGCSGITNITIDNGVQTIGDWVFDNCIALTSVTFKRNGITIGSCASGFPANLKTAYTADGAGIYMRITGSNDWLKEGSVFAALAEQLSYIGIGSTSTDHPATITLSEENINSQMSRINEIVQAAEKYVILDLSDCTATGNTVTGKSSPSANDMNIINDNQYIKGVILPSTLETIGDYAFEYCSALTTITIGNSVTSIGTGAFGGCTALTNIIIPDSVTSIGDMAFLNSSLNSITIPDSITSVGTWAFDSLTSVTFEGNGISSIFSSSFPGNLASVYTAGGAGTYTRTAGQDNWTKVVKFAPTVNDTTVNDETTLGLIGTAASSSNISVAAVEIAEGKIKITSVSAGSAIITVSNNSGNEATINITVSGEGVITIGTIAKYILSSNTITALKEQLAALTGTSESNPAMVKLTSLTFTNAASVPEGMVGWGEINALVSNAQKYVILNLSDCTAESNTVTGGLSPVGNEMGIIRNNQYVKGIILPSTLETIGNTAFNNCSYLTSVIIPYGVTSIGSGRCDTFSGSGLTSITIPNSVMYIGKDAFLSCTALESVILSNSITSIADETFLNCPNLTSIIIPNSVTSIGYRAFDECDNLTSVKFEGSSVAINSSYPFPGNLATVYATGGAGTYTRIAGQDNWTKGKNIAVSVEMVLIPAGTFIMGSPTTEANRKDHETQHEVTLSKNLYIGKYEITQAQYSSVIGSNPSFFTSGAASGEIQENRPVELVNWYEAIAFCNALSEKEGLTSAYTVSGTNVTWIKNTNGYRLPTEAEWEYACRAGTTTAYNIGDTISDDIGWSYNNSNGKTHEVGKKSANTWGLYDMHGNVQEWCWDWYGSYPDSAQIDPEGPSSGNNRVHRGACWGHSWTGGVEDMWRSAFRYGETPQSKRQNDIGFRVVRPVE